MKDEQITQQTINTVGNGLPRMERNPDKSRWDYKGKRPFKAELKRYRLLLKELLKTTEMNSPYSMKGL